MTKIVAISDTHNRHEQIIIPECDILIHAGDATGLGEVDEMAKFFVWFGKQPAKHKIYVAGNHDWLASKYPKMVESLCGVNNIIFLNNSSIEINGIKFWGSPITPRFGYWAFMRDRGADIKEVWDKIPEDTNVLITHGPPYGICDELQRFDGTPTGQHVGCEELWERVEEIKPKVHIFGHIHCGYGKVQSQGTDFYNVSICGETYFPDNDPTVIDYV